MTRWKSMLGFGALAGICVCAVLYVMHAPAAVAFDNAHWGANYFPNVELTTQDGRKVRFYDDLIRGKIVVIDLIYTHCVDSCPLETARLAQVQKILGDRVGTEIFFYSITIDPKRDTPAVLKAYAEKYHVAPGWTFLTGKKEDIDLVSKKLGLYTEPDPADRDGHMPSVLLGNEPMGQWMRNGATDNPRFLSRLIGDWLNNYKYADNKPTRNTEVTTMKLDPGQYIFSSHCAACHTVGHGDHIGPDLAGVTNVRDHDWLVRFIKEPDKLLNAHDPLAVTLFEKYKQVQMPNLRLADGDVAEVLKFLETQSNSNHSAAVARATGSAMRP